MDRFGKNLLSYNGLTYRTSWTHLNWYYNSKVSKLSIILLLAASLLLLLLLLLLFSFSFSFLLLFFDFYNMTDIRIPLLPTVKCTNCHIYIDVRTLDNHICVPIKKMTLPSLSGQIMTTSQDSDLTDPHTRTSTINSSVRHILRKIKGSEHKSIDTVASPTLSMASSTLSNNTMITTPRSSKDDLQHYIVGPHMDSTPLQKSNSGIANSFTLSKSKGRKSKI